MGAGGAGAGQVSEHKKRWKCGAGTERTSRNRFRPGRLASAKAAGMAKASAKHELVRATMGQLREVGSEPMFDERAMEIRKGRGKDKLRDQSRRSTRCLNAESPTQTNGPSAMATIPGSRGSAGFECVERLVR